jgi:hypothetical protein
MKNLFTASKFVYRFGRPSAGPSEGREKGPEAKKIPKETLIRVTTDILNCKRDAKLPELKKKAREFVKRYKDNPVARLNIIKRGLTKYVKSKVSVTLENPKESAIHDAAVKIDNAIQKLAFTPSEKLAKKTTKPKRRRKA